MKTRGQRVVVINKPGRRSLKLALKERGREIEVLGLVLGEETGDYGLEVEMDHWARETKGRVIVRGVAKNGARVKVRGLIKVGKQMEQVDSFFEGRFLILDDASTVEVSPELEIENDEVKVSHAVTVSRIREEELFYLMSRGLGREEGERLIVKGFLGKLVGRIKDDNLGNKLLTD